MFIPLILLLAAFWAAIGVLLARWLKQAGYARPLKFTGRDLNLYGAGTGFGRETGFEGRERMEGRVLAGQGRDVRGVSGGWGGGRVKGL
ncbi:hypothetical protein HBI87_050870 [Parastagonospora nodorum]|nr:hypothetical protein HBI87_050870 [Parastagonospora nodorum]